MISAVGGTEPFSALAKLGDIDVRIRRCFVFGSSAASLSFFMTIGDFDALDTCCFVCATGKGGGGGGRGGAGGGTEVGTVGVIESFSLATRLGDCNDFSD